MSLEVLTLTSTEDWRFTQETKTQLGERYSNVEIVYWKQRVTHRSLNYNRIKKHYFRGETIFRGISTYFHYEEQQHYKLSIRTNVLFQCDTNELCNHESINDHSPIEIVKVHLSRFQYPRVSVYKSQHQVTKNFQGKQLRLNLHIWNMKVRTSNLDRSNSLPTIAILNLRHD